jgi:hypothetical protein
VFIFANFSFALFNPPLGDYHLRHSLQPAGRDARLVPDHREGRHLASGAKSLGPRLRHYGSRRDRRARRNYSELALVRPCNALTN